MGHKSEQKSYGTLPECFQTSDTINSRNLDLGTTGVSAGKYCKGMLLCKGDAMDTL